jgi:general secretion pathway protein C
MSFDTTLLLGSAHARSARRRFALLAALAFGPIAAPALAAGARKPAPVVEPGPEEHEIARAEVFAAFGGRAAHAQARIVPETQDGRTTGFRVYAVAPEGPFAKLGLRNGDVVQKIDGHALTSPAQAHAAYAKLKEAPRIVLGISRAGAPLELVCVLK